MFTTSRKVPTGIAGLDDILSGGWERERLFLVEGTPGTGKTTLALKFLLSGAAAGETGLYVTLSESFDELTAVAGSHGWSLDKLDVFELLSGDWGSVDTEQTVLHPSELELGETIRAVMARVTETNPSRVVFDSLSELRLLSQGALRYRRQILALKRFFVQRGCTVLLLDDRSAGAEDAQLHSIAHGVLTLEQVALEFGAERRRLRVMKYRGSQFRGGYHDYVIRPGGLDVFPRLVASEHHRLFDGTLVGTGNARLDDLLGGGLTPGTSTLLTGSAGVGKSTTAITAVVAALRRGERAAYFLFDEGLPTLLSRSASLGLDLVPYVDGGALALRQIDPAEMSPGEFAGLVRRAVEDGIGTIVVDSINAYLHSMPGETFLLLQMHELLTYLNQKGVVTLLILSQSGTIGALRSSVDLSYLADSVVMMRFFEAGGEVRKAISVVKTRTTNHERSIRELSVGEGGLLIGPPLKGFHGVLSGIPTWDGDGSDLMPAGNASL